MVVVILVGCTGHIGGQMVHKPVTVAPAKEPAGAATAPTTTPAPAK